MKRKKNDNNKYNGVSYMITKISYNELSDIGFRFSVAEESYYYKFIIKKWNKYPVLFGKIKVNEFTGEITVDVLKENGEFYTPFYANKYGKYDVNLVNTINRRIDNEFKKLGITKEKINYTDKETI